MRFWIVMLSVTFSFILAACGASSQPQTTTAVPIPSGTPIPPTTPLAPTVGPTSAALATAAPTLAARATATNVSGTPTVAAQVPADIRGALANNIKASKFRAELQLVTTGPSATSGAQSGGRFQIAYIIDGQNRQVSYPPGIIGPAAIDPSLPIDELRVNNQTYFRNLMAGEKTTDAKQWYTTGQPLGETLPDPSSMFGEATREELAKGTNFKKQRSERLDNRSCDVYTATEGAFVEENKSDLDPQAFATLDKAEMAVWVCDDGFLHQGRVTIEGHNASNQKSTYQFTAHYFDFNASNIKLEAPPNAVNIAP